MTHSCTIQGMLKLGIVIGTVIHNRRYVCFVIGEVRV